MNGDGCREFERNNPNKSWYNLLIVLRVQNEGRASRIDVTIDDYDGDIVIFNFIKDKLEREMYTSSFKKNYSILGNKYDGQSITFGRRQANSKSSQQLVIYEKNKEQISKGHECNQEYWTRLKEETP